MYSEFEFLFITEIFLVIKNHRLAASKYSCIRNFFYRQGDSDRSFVHPKKYSSYTDF